jgi:hypothetical protein
MKTSKIDSKIVDIKPMSEYLLSLGKKATFSSDVNYVVMDDQSTWVLKIYPSPINFYDLQQIIGEVAAYKISKKTGIDLVPKTSIVIYNGKLGSLQKFIDDKISKEIYPKLLASQNLEIQKLKLFWFIAGQWDTDIDNLLFNSDAKPIAIDNANISNQQKTSAYGKPTFVKTFKFNEDNQGSIDAPITIEGKAKKVLGNLTETFKDELPQSLRDSVEKKEGWFHFSYFVEDKFVWRDFYPFDEVQAYFMEDFSKSAVDMFNNIVDTSNKDIFSKAIDYSLNAATENGITLESEVSKESLTAHFATIYSGIEARYIMVKNFWHDQHQFLENVNTDQICVFETTASGDITD